MTFSGPARFRGTPGSLTVGGGSLVFTHTDGFFSKTQRILLTLPVSAIVSVQVEGTMRKKLVVLVDSYKIPGIPRHEFEVADPYRWIGIVQAEMASQASVSSQQVQPPTSREVYVREFTREIVKVPCPYCGMLNEVTEKRCHSCGAPVGR